MATNVKGRRPYADQRGGRPLDPVLPDPVPVPDPPVPLPAPAPPAPDPAPMPPVPDEVPDPDVPDPDVPDPDMLPALLPDVVVLVVRWRRVRWRRDFVESLPEVAPLDEPAVPPCDVPLCELPVLVEPPVAGCWAWLVDAAPSAVATVSATSVEAR